MSEQERLEEALGDTFVARGYVVVASDFDMRIGEVCEVSDHKCDVQPMRIVARTDYADWVEHCRMLGYPRTSDLKPHYYRAESD